MVQQQIRPAPPAGRLPLQAGPSEKALPLPSDRTPVLAAVQGTSDWLDPAAWQLVVQFEGGFAQNWKPEYIRVRSTESRQGRPFGVDRGTAVCDGVGCLLRGDPCCSSLSPPPVETPVSTVPSPLSLQQLSCVRWGHQAFAASVQPLPGGHTAPGSPTMPPLHPSTLQVSNDSGGSRTFCLPKQGPTASGWLAASGSYTFVPCSPPAQQAPGAASTAGSPNPEL